MKKPSEKQIVHSLLTGIEHAMYTSDVGELTSIFLQDREKVAVFLRESGVPEYRIQETIYRVAGFQNEALLRIREIIDVAKVAPRAKRDTKVASDPSTSRDAAPISQAKEAPKLQLSDNEMPKPDQGTNLGLLVVSKELPSFADVKKKPFGEMTTDDLFVVMRKVLVDALGVEENEVTIDAQLIGDLGAESIDFLDIIFRLEKNLPIKIGRTTLFPEDISLADKKLIVDGKVTPAGIDELRRRMPHAEVELQRFSDNPVVENINELYSVQMMMRYLLRRQQPTEESTN